MVVPKKKHNENESKKNVHSFKRKTKSEKLKKKVAKKKSCKKNKKKRFFQKCRKKTKRKAREGLEPSTSCLLDRRNNPYATKPFTYLKILFKTLIILITNSNQKRKKND